MENRSVTNELRSNQLFRFFGLLSIIILIFFNLFTYCTKVNKPFYDKILNDFDTNSYFIALDIKSPFYKGRVIIENNYLYSYLNNTKGTDKEKYKSFIKKILAHNKALKVSDKDFEALHFIRIYESENVIHNANSGIDNFIAHYFNGVVLNPGIPEIEKNAIINQLFYWNIPSKIEKNTGYLLIGQ